MLTLALSPAAAAGDAHHVLKKTTIPLTSIEKTIPAELFPTGFLLGDSNYHSIVAASDGNLYFSVDTHNTDYACRIYRFDPRTDTMNLVAKLDEVLHEDAATHIAQGKIHTPFFEYNGKLYFGTHISFYAGDLPGTDPGVKTPYQGGHFMSYDLQTGAFDDLAKTWPNEGIITTAMDTQRGILYGLTWPAGILLSFNLDERQLHVWGAVQDRGEWGHRGEEWDRICRTLGIDPEGHVYGSTMDGRIWKFDRAQPRPFTYIEGLDLRRLPFAQSAEETLKGDFQYNWRVLEWNPETRSFWGIQWETTTLFEFVPESNYLRAVAELRHDAYRGMPRNPEISQLGFKIAPNNRIYYLANGPAVTIEQRPDVQSTVYLITYDINTGQMKNHGPVISKDGRRVFFTESLSIGPDNHIYTVAWVEAIDPARIDEIAKARQFGPAETERMLYEIMLVRLPQWKKFR